jgi:hypothetical protein
MLQIRQEQIDLFRRQPRLTFERELASYLSRHFPFEAANADLDRWVRSGLEKAAFNGFLTRSESAQYLALMAILGAGFDEDPLIPWAAKALFTHDTSSLERIGHVFAEAVRFLDATGGPKCAWLIRAKLRVRKQDMRVLDKGAHPRALSAQIQEVLIRIYPQKAAVLGTRALKQLGDSALERAEQRGAKCPRPALIDAVHRFFFGSAYENDPCYPWTCKMPDGADGTLEQRFDQMHQLSLDYLDRSFRFRPSGG